MQLSKVLSSNEDSANESTLRVIVWHFGNHAYLLSGGELWHIHIITNFAPLLCVWCVESRWSRGVLKVWICWTLTWAVLTFFRHSQSLCWAMLELKVIIANIFNVSSFTAPMMIIGNCKCVFGPHFPSFIVCNHWSCLCLFGHNNRLLAMLAETGKNSMPLHTQVSWWVEERVCCVKSPVKSLTVRCCVIFPGKFLPTPRSEYCKCTGFHRPHSAIDSDLASNITIVVKVVPFSNITAPLGVSMLSRLLTVAFSFLE